MQTLFHQPWKDETYYRAQWASFYQFRRRLLKRFFLGIAPFFVAIGIMDGVNHAFFNNPSSTVNFALITIGLVSWAYGGYTIFVTNWQLLAWDCPRCGERFFQGSGGRKPLARHCRHCGLRRPSKSEVPTKV